MVTQTWMERHAHTVRVWILLSVAAYALIGLGVVWLLRTAAPDSDWPSGTRSSGGVVSEPAPPAAVAKPLPPCPKRIYGHPIGRLDCTSAPAPALAPLRNNAEPCAALGICPDPPPPVEVDRAFQPAASSTTRYSW